MVLRFALVAALALLAGCTWTSRPDGGFPRHTDEGTDPLDRVDDLSTEVQPLDDGTVVEPLGPAGAPATGTAVTGAAPAPDAMPLAPSAPAPTGTLPSAGSATGDGSATRR